MENLETELDNIIDECILRHHTEMYFTMILGYMLSSEYREPKVELNINDIYVNYKKICAIILMDCCNVHLPEMEKTNFNEINNIRQKYSDMIEHGKLYSKVISTYAIGRESIQKTILTTLNERGPIYSKFYQRCMIRGFEIANTRILSKMESKDYFGHEIIATKDSKVLKRFLRLMSI